MKNNINNTIRQVITYNILGSRSMAVGRNRCTKIEHYEDKGSVYVSYDKDGNFLQRFENGNFAVEFFKPKENDCGAQKSESKEEEVK